MLGGRADRASTKLGAEQRPRPPAEHPPWQPTGGKMEPVTESFSLLEEYRKRDTAGYTGEFIFSDNKEERDIFNNLKRDALPQLPEAHSPDRGADCNQPPHQNKSSKKLTLVADGQKPLAEEKPYQCAECGKGFKVHTRLLNHLQTHTREKTFECVECGRSFNRKANLVVHQRVHTGERPYKCKECEKTFSRTSNLIAHHKTHAKKASFSCTKCRRSFSGSAALFEHQRVHMDEKPFRCTECGTSFRLCSNLMKHQLFHLKGKPREHLADNEKSGAEKREMDHLNLLHEELKKMRENMDMLLLNQQSQLQVLQEIQKQLSILLPGNDLINSNVYSLGLLLERQAAAAASLSFPLLNPSSLVCENANLFSQSSAPGVLLTPQVPVSQYPAVSTT